MFLVVETLLFQNERWDSMAKQCETRIVGPRNNPKYPQSDYSWYRGWCSSLDVSRDRGACFLRPLHK